MSCFESGRADVLTLPATFCVFDSFFVFARNKTQKTGHETEDVGLLVSLAVFFCFAETKCFACILSVLLAG